MGQKIEIYYGGMMGSRYSYLDDDPKDQGLTQKEKIIAYLKKSELYKMVQKL